MIPSNRRSIKRIMVRSANWVGDAVITTPALHALRVHYQNARITLLAKPWVIPVFEQNTDIDDIMVYQAEGRHKGPAGLWRLARDLRQRRFDMAILLQNAFEAGLLTFLAGIPHRVGFTTDGRSALLTQRIRTWRPLKQGHLIDYYLGLMRGAGIAPAGRDLKVVISADECRAALNMIAAHGLSDARWMVGFNPGATFGTAKRWPVQRFARLGRRLREETGAAVLVFGAAAEQDLGARIADEIGPGCVNFCGRTTLRQAMALIRTCHLFITNDSGLMHVAAALNVPQVALIGPTDPVATGPSNAAGVVLRAPQACALMPCLKPDCPEDHRCMKAISIDQVFIAGTDLLYNSGRLI